MNLNDSLDYGAGIVLNKSIGDYIKKEEVIMTLHTSKKLKEDIDFLSAFKIEKKKAKKEKIIYDVIN